MADKKTSISILFICRGNICRSPMAEYILRDMVARDPVLSQDGIRISSAGTGENNSVSASDQTVLVMMERGLKQIIKHKGQAINAGMLSQADIILTMDDENKEVILSRFPDAANRTFLLSEYAGSSGNILDPTGKSTEMYRVTADIIERYLMVVADKLRIRSVAIM